MEVRLVRVNLFICKHHEEGIVPSNQLGSQKWRLNGLWSRIEKEMAIHRIKQYTGILESNGLSFLAVYRDWIIRADELSTLADKPSPLFPL